MLYYAALYNNDVGKYIKSTYCEDTDLFLVYIAFCCSVSTYQHCMSWLMYNLPHLKLMTDGS